MEQTITGDIGLIASAEAAAQKDSPTYKLEIYEGPLDLLLSLVRKNKMDINDIEISIICAQYMEYLDLARKFDMELASEFVVMASELMLIKSRMLLPRPPEPPEDPRAWLSEALSIYERAKEASGLLLPMYAQYAGRYVKDEDEVSASNEPPEGLDPGILSKTLSLLLNRLEASDGANENLIKPLLSSKPVSISRRIHLIVDLLSDCKKATLFSILAHSQSRSELIASFIALLELIKSGALDIEYEDDESGEIGYNVNVSLAPDGREIALSFTSELEA